MKLLFKIISFPYIKHYRYIVRVNTFHENLTQTIFSLNNVCHKKGHSIERENNKNILNILLSKRGLNIRRTQGRKRGGDAIASKVKFLTSFVDCYGTIKLIYKFSNYSTTMIVFIFLPNILSLCVI